MGTLNVQNEFDGYTCSDEKEKLYFAKADSNAQYNLYVAANMSAFTVEMWIKAASGLLGENYFLSITDSPRTSTSPQYLNILQEQDNILSCYPLIPFNSSTRVRYLDYQKDSRDWIHVACIFDANKTMARG